MNLELGYGVYVLNPTPLDPKYLNGNVPYTSVAQVNSLIPIGVRSVGLTVNIANQEYWYKSGVANNQLILKSQDLTGYALDANVLHKTGNESKLGSLQVSDSNLAGFGIKGTSNFGSAVYGESIEGFGVYGVCQNSVGVYGHSENEFGGRFNTQNGSKIASFLTNNVEKVSINSNGTITASPAILPDQVVVKSQLDAIGGGEGVTDHTLLTNIGTNTHAQIDTALTRLANTSGTNTGDQDLSGFALDVNLLHRTGDEIKEGKLSFLFNYDTGDPTTGGILEGLTSINSGPPTTQFLVTKLGDIFAKNLEIAGTILATQYKISALNIAPSSATATGTLGEIRITAGFIYVCIATNTWVRTALTTW